MKPREFWISLYKEKNILGAYSFEAKPGIHIDPDTDEVIYVREVVPIDWRKIYEDLPITWPMALLEIRKRIEKQLAGEDETK